MRTVSPSRYSTTRPRLSSSGPITCAIVDLPDPERPVNQRVKPPGRTRSDSGWSCAWMLSVMRYSSSFVVTWMPHSSLSEPAQRPARSSSSGAVGRVQGMHPIDR